MGDKTAIRMATSGTIPPCRPQAGGTPGDDEAWQAMASVLRSGGLSALRLQPNLHDLGMSGLVAERAAAIADVVDGMRADSIAMRGRGGANVLA